MTILDNLKTNLKNIPGKRVTKKYLIIECDDWGSIRMPSGKVFKLLKDEGLISGNSRYYQDTLANSEDLEKLFEVLSRVKDNFGNNPVFTAVSNMANPDFVRIKESDFKIYHYEEFTKTLERYYNGEKVFELWKQGISAGIFTPELHGREHITTQVWMQELRAGNRDLRKAFDYGFVSLSLPHLAPYVNEFRPEFYFQTKREIPQLNQSIEEAIQIFISSFGFAPKVFAPTNLMFHPLLENKVVEKGIEFMYVNRKMEVPDGMGGIQYKRYYPGFRGKNGLTYYSRNCVFEPSASNYSGIDFTLMQIAAAFRWGKPAIISTHRANFVGAINKYVRKMGLKELELLLHKVIKRWPDVEFISSRDALKMIYK